MKKSNNLVLKFLICMGLAIFLLFGVGSAQAALELPDPYGTLTFYDVNADPDNALDFKSSPPLDYSLVDIEPKVFVDSIEVPIPGSFPREVGKLYEFVIPNFYDPLPIKTIYVEMLGANAGAQPAVFPYVLDIVGSDSPYGEVGWASPVYASYVGGKDEPTMVTQMWKMSPNPDWEIVKIYAPVEFELQSIEIATQSMVPIPQTILLLGSGLAVLLGIARRRMR
jgi:hypothetical protein